MRPASGTAGMLALALSAAVGLSAAHAKTATLSGTIEGKVAIVDREGPRRDYSDVVVFLEGAFPRPPAPASAAGAKHAAAAPLPSVTSKDKRFAPKVLAVKSGAVVDFPNVDRIYHNVFSLSPGNKFDLGLYRNGATKQQALASPGLVRVYCNIHPQMVGYVWVFDHPYFTRARPDGSFTLAEVPLGTWQLKMWDERGGEKAQPVSVTAGTTAVVTFSSSAVGFKPQPHKNKFGQDYKKTSGDDDEVY